MIKAKHAGLPASMCAKLKAARIKLGISQAELGRRAGLPQAHVSGIETGKIIPGYNTLVDLVRILGEDLILVPRELVPAVQSLIRDSLNTDQDDSDDLPLYGRGTKKSGGESGKHGI